MGHNLKERLKTACIYVLIITGLLQVGILWSYQNQGTPTGFLLGLFRRGTAPISDEIVNERLFVPDRLILSDGNYSHWLMKKGSEDYGILWDNAVNGLRQIASGKTGLTRTSEEWGDIVEKRGYMVDFGYSVRPDLLAWFLGVKEPPQAFPDVRKVMIKNDVVDEDSNTFYIYGSDGTIYSTAPVILEKEKSLNAIIQIISGNELMEYRKYYTFAGANKGKESDAPDVLYATVAPRFWPYPEVSVRAPAGAGNEEELAAIILGNEKDRYIKSTDESGAIHFSFGSNIYRYYPDGYLTYRYLGDADTSGTGGVGEALVNAYDLIDRIQGILSAEPDIVLSSVSEKADGSYVFGFDYRVEGMPVDINIESKDGSRPELTHAASVQADGERVLACDGLLKDFVRHSGSNYDDRLFDLLGSAGMDFNDIDIQDIIPGYYVRSYGGKKLRPALLIQLKSDKRMQLDMIPETGD